MNEINNEINRFGNGKWRPLCSIDRGDIHIELQVATKGIGQRIFASRLEKRWHKPRNQFEGEFFSYHYFATNYLPTAEDRLLLNSKIP